MPRWAFANVLSAGATVASYDPSTPSLSSHIDVTAALEAAVRALATSANLTYDKIEFVSATPSDSEVPAANAATSYLYTYSNVYPTYFESYTGSTGAPIQAGIEVQWHRPAGSEYTSVPVEGVRSLTLTEDGRVATLMAAGNVGGTPSLQVSSWDRGNCNVSIGSGNLVAGNLAVSRVTMADSTYFLTAPLGGGITSQLNPFGDNAQILYATLNGSAVDHMGNYTFTTTGAVTYGAEGSKFGYTSPTFGSGLYLATTTNISLTGTTSRSMCCWVKSKNRNQTNDPVVIIGYGGQTGTNTLFSICSHLAGSNQWATWHNGFDNGSSIPTDQLWHFIAATYDGYQIVLYLDGQVIARKLSTCDTQSGLFYIGTANVTSYNVYFQGCVNSARVFNRALQAYEIHQLYLYGR